LRRLQVTRSGTISKRLELERPSVSVEMRTRCHQLGASSICTALSIAAIDQQLDVEGCAYFG
jgi:predicted XRE-type DNA-binding protein